MHCKHYKWKLKLEFFCLLEKKMFTSWPNFTSKAESLVNVCYTFFWPASAETIWCLVILLVTGEKAKFLTLVKPQDTFNWTCLDLFAITTHGKCWIQLVNRIHGNPSSISFEFLLILSYSLPNTRTAPNPIILNERVYSTIILKVCLFLKIHKY